MATPAQRMQSDRLRYPALLPREIAVLRAWLALHQAEYDYFDYNVRVGQGTDPGPTFTAEERRAAIMNSQKRIDALAWTGAKPDAADYLEPYSISDKLAERGAAPTMIEVKDRATAAAVTQLLTYEALWSNKHPSTPPPVLILVANRVDPDIFLVAQKYNIRVDLVEADFSGI